MTYLKPLKNYADQLDQLIARGMQITDRAKAMDALKRIEIALRVDISHTLGKRDKFAYLKPLLFHREFSEK